MKKLAKDVEVGDTIYFPNRRVPDTVIAVNIAEDSCMLLGAEVRWTLPPDEEVELR